MCLCGGRGDWAAVFNNLDAAGLCKGEKITCKGDVTSVACGIFRCSQGFLL